VSESSTGLAGCDEQRLPRERPLRERAAPAPPIPREEPGANLHIEVRTVDRHSFMTKRLMPTANNHDVLDDALQVQLNLKIITFGSECTRTLSRPPRENEE
jgi:hypothetical protein